MAMAYADCVFVFCRYYVEMVLSEQRKWHEWLSMCSTRWQKEARTEPYGWKDEMIFSKAHFVLTFFSLIFLLPYTLGLSAGVVVDVRHANGMAHWDYTVTIFVFAWKRNRFYVPTYECDTERWIRIIREKVKNNNKKSQREPETGWMGAREEVVNNISEPRK